MTDKPKPRATISPSDMDAQGMVTVWDRGPQPLPADPKPTEDEVRAHDAGLRAWKTLHGDNACPVKMHANDAVHAVQTDPERYSLDPVADEAAIDAEVKKIQEARAADEKAAAERAAAVQLAADRQTAVAALMARRAAPPRPDTTKPGVGTLETAARHAEAAAEADAAEAARLRTTTATPDVIEAARVKAASSRTAATTARQLADDEAKKKAAV